MADAADKDPDPLKKGPIIRVNGQELTSPTEELTYQGVVRLAIDREPDSNEVYTVTFQDAVRTPDGTLVRGDPAVKVQDGTTFTVTLSDQT